MRFFADTMLVAAFAVVGTAFPLAADAEEVSDTFNGFRLDTRGIPVALSTLADVASLAEDWPVTYRTGETVTYVAPDGTIGTLVSDAASAGTVPFSPNAGGLWRLENAGVATAYVGVGWSVFGDGSVWSFSMGSPFCIHTVGAGPDRRGRSDKFPSVAYSGDDWIGDASKAVTLTFSPPADSGLSPTVVNRTGTGTQSFTFDEAGCWTVLMEMADGTTREATVFVKAGFVLMFR